MSEVWVGRTEVAKANGCELEFRGAGAYVWWATQTHSEREFLCKLSEAIEHYKLVLLEVSHVRRFCESDRVSDDFFRWSSVCWGTRVGCCLGLFTPIGTMTHDPIFSLTGSSLTALLLTAF